MVKVFGGGKKSYKSALLEDVKMQVCNPDWLGKSLGDCKLCKETYLAQE